MFEDEVVLFEWGLSAVSLQTISEYKLIKM
jgi:hypothetical protein